MKPVVAIIGRPNVGKSTLFNRMTRTRDALVDDFPGVTRDRHYGAATWNDREFSVMDTGGFSTGDGDDFTALSRDQVGLAIQAADAVVLVMDGKAGVSPFDAELLDLLRTSTCPVFYAVNKIDGMHQETQLDDFYRLGVDPLYPVSAEHGYGVPDFLDDLAAALPETPTEHAEDAVNIAIIGRPNVGKSSLMNRIAGENRAIVSHIPGTTRDAIDTELVLGGRRYRFIDTAGIRRKKQVFEKIEKIAILKALQSIDRCDIALIVMDAREGVTDQDVKIAGHAFERGCGCIFLFNKWDLVEKSTRTLARFVETLRMEAKFLNFAPVLAISAMTGSRVSKIFSLVNTVHDQYSTRVTTGRINQIIERATLRTEPPLHQGRRLKIFYATQIAAKPPTIQCFANYPEGFHFSYQRYLINQIRQETGLDQTPIRLVFKKRTSSPNRTNIYKALAQHRQKSRHFSP